MMSEYARLGHLISLNTNHPTPFYFNLLCYTNPAIMTRIKIKDGLTTQLENLKEILIEIKSQ